MIFGAILRADKPPEARPPQWFTIRDLNESETEIWPGQVKTIHFEITSGDVTIDKIEFRIHPGEMELAAPLTYGKKVFKLGEAMYLSVSVRSLIRGFQGFGIRIFSHNSKGVSEELGSRAGHYFFPYGIPGQKSGRAMRSEQESLARYGRKPTWTEEEYRLAEKEEKIQESKPIAIDIPYKEGTTRNLTADEYWHMMNKRDFPNWYQEMVKKVPQK